MGDAVVITSREFNSLDRELHRVASEFAFKVLRSGVVCVGDEVDDVIIDSVVIPANVVVVTVESRSGDDSAVKVVYVGVCVGAVNDVDELPPADFFLSILLRFSAGAGDEPPRHGKQQRNSVEQNKHL